MKVLKVVLLVFSAYKTQSFAAGDIPKARRETPVDVVSSTNEKIQGQVSTDNSEESQREVSSPPNGIISVDKLGQPSISEQGVGTDSDFSSWVDRALLSTLEKASKKIVFFKDEKKIDTISFLDIQADKFNKYSFFRTKSREDLDWALKLNKRSHKNTELLKFVSLVTQANIAVNTSSAEKWSMFDLEKNRSVLLGEFAAPKDNTEEAILAWLSESLGWDGIVIDRKDDLLLVWTGRGGLSKDFVQAIAVKNSQKKTLITPPEKKGSSLLSLLYRKSQIGVFKILFLGQDVNNIPIGSKLIIQKD